MDLHHEASQSSSQSQLNVAERQSERVSSFVCAVLVMTTMARGCLAGEKRSLSQLDMTRAILHH